MEEKKEKNRIFFLGCIFICIIATDNFLKQSLGCRKKKMLRLLLKMRNAVITLSLVVCYNDSAPFSKEMFASHYPYLHYMYTV